MPGRHRMGNRSGAAGAIAAALALIVVVGGSYYGYRSLAEPACSGEARLTVAAAPEIAPAIEDAAGAWVDGGAEADGICVAVDVTDNDPVDVAAVVAGRHGVSLAGVGQPSGTLGSPDVWVPDSSTWLLRLRGAASGFAPTNVTSIARSPVVVAMPEPVAAAVGWPRKQAHLGRPAQPVQLRHVAQARHRGAHPRRGRSLRSPRAERRRAGIRRQRASGVDRGAARAGLRQVGSAAGPAGPVPALGRPRHASRPRSARRRCPRKTSSQYNSTKPPIPLAALYIEPAPISLDYPYAVMPGTDPVKVKAAEGLFRVLTTERLQEPAGRTAPARGRRHLGRGLRGAHRRAEPGRQPAGDRVAQRRRHGGRRLRPGRGGGRRCRPGPR